MPCELMDWSKTTKPFSKVAPPLSPIFLLKLQRAPILNAREVGGQKQLHRRTKRAS